MRYFLNWTENKIYQIVFVSRVLSAIPKSHIKLILAISVIILASATSAQSCDCKTATTEEYYEYSDVVFTGEVLKVIENSDFWSSFWYIQNEKPRPITLVQIKITEIFKGLNPELKYISLPIDYSSCQYSFDEGREFLIYGEEIVSNPGIVMTWDCSGNHVVKDNQSEEFSLLRKLRSETNHHEKVEKKDLINQRYEFEEKKSNWSFLIYFLLSISLIFNVILMIKHSQKISL